MKKLIEFALDKWKNNEIYRYLFFGVLTTLVSWLAKFVWNLVFYHNAEYPTPLQNFILSLVCWTAGVIFAFFTNRAFVFEKTQASIWSEASKFVASRLSTLVLDIIAMQVLCEVIGINVFLSTLIAEFLVTVANYFLSKKFVFRSSFNFPRGN